MFNNVIYPLFFLLSGIIHGQIQFQGRVINAKTEVGLPFVNIGIPNKGIGTVSDEMGFYQLEVTPKMAEEVLRFSMIGFSSQEVKIKNADTNNKNIIDIALIPELINLNEVVVTDAKWKKIRRGNRTDSKNFQAGFDSNQLGTELAQFVRVKKNRPTKLLSFWLSVSKNQINEQVTLRLNIYDEKDGFPATNILSEPIYIKLPKDPSTVNVSLRPYDIYLEDSFFISIEWLEDLGKDNLWFSVGLLGNSLYARSASHARWARLKPLNIGMGVEMLQKQN